MTTYDNLNIAQTTLVFQMVGATANSSISSGIFDLSSLAFLPNIPLIDQIEVERVFDTGYDTKFGAYVFTIADRRQIFIFPKNWYTINEQTKVLTFKDLSTIPVKDDGQGGGNGLYYPYSRTYTLQNAEDLNIPTVQATSSVVNGITRQADIVYIRRKTPSINSIVTFAPGTRLTTTQLNLQFDQLKYNIQELVAKFRNEAILKYDENAIDGPFLGQGDLKMNNNYIKDVNSPAFTQAGTNIVDSVTGLNFTANTFLVNLGTVATGIISGTLHRTGLNSSPPVFSGDYDAGNLKLINLTNGSSAQDAATMGQISNASNLTSGTLVKERLADASIPLEKLSASRVTYTLPEAALPSANALTGTTGFGSSTATNTNNIIYASVDTKGRITLVGHRNLATADLPTIGGVAGTYGDSTTVLTQVTVDSTGRITAASERALTATDIPAVNASAITGALVAGNLPAVSAGGGGATTVTSIPTSITVDTLGRVTAVSGGSITASNVSDFNTAVQTSKLNQMAAPIAAVSLNNQKILLLSDPTIATDAANKNYIDTNFTSNTNLNGAIQANRLDQMTAPIAAVTLNNQKITNLGTPTLSTDAATRGYIDTNYTLSSALNTPIDQRLATNSVYLSAAGILNAGGKPITNVGATTNANDVVTKSYLEANAIYATGSNLSAGTKYLTDLIMRPSGSLSANDAVNFGYIESAILNAGGGVVGTSAPQVFKQTWASANAISTATPASTSFIRYQFNFADSTNPLYATSATMMLVEGTGGTRVFTPNISDATAGTVYDGYFWLNTGGGATKVLNVYVSSTPTGDITIRNFGLSRVVSGGVATTSSTGLVSIASGNDGGISVSGPGALALIPATSSQIGGIKLGTTLSTSSGLVNVVFPIAGTATLGQVMVAAVGTSGLNLNTSTGALSLPTATTTQLGGIKLGNTLSISSDVVNVVFPTATNSALGQVFVAAVATSGLSLDLATGALSLPTASTTQLGGVKVNTSTGGLTNTSGVIAVSFSDSINSTSTTTAANSKAVNDLRTSSMLLDGTQTMTGKLKTFASTASVASLNVPIGSAVTTRTSGDIWNVSGNLQYSPDGTAIKTLAYLDSSITGNAATATALTPGGTITLSGAVTSSATTFTGSAISIATTLAAGQAVTSLSSSTMTVSASTGAVTLTLPQAIGTTDAVIFGKVTLGNIRISNTANQIDTSSGNLTLDSAGGTTTINDTVSIAGPLTVTGSNATTLGGAVTLSSTLALSTAPCTIALGGAAGAALTSINSAGSATGANQIGDIILRTPSNGRAFLVANATNTTLTTANDAIVTKGVMDSAISTAGNAYISTAGAIRSTGSQTFGSSDSSFIVSNNSIARLTIANNGASTFANALTVSTGGLTVTTGGLTSVGTTSLTGTVTINSTASSTDGVIIAAQAPSSGSHLTNKTYVDSVRDSISDTNANLVLKKMLMQTPIRQYAVAPVASGDGKIVTHTAEISNLVVGVPKYLPSQHAANGTKRISIVVPENYQIIFLYFSSDHNSLVAGFNALHTVSNLQNNLGSPVSEMLTLRGSSGTFTRLTQGNILTGGVGGTTFVVSEHFANSNFQLVDLILMRIA